MAKSILGVHHVTAIAGDPDPNLDFDTRLLGLPRTTLVYRMRKLGIETCRSRRARPILQLPDEQCRAAASF